MTNWPRWFFRFDFPDGKIFKSAEEVPAGCVESPADVRIPAPPLAATPAPLAKLDEKPEVEPTPKKHKRKTGRPRKVKK